AVEALAGEIHPVDREATQIWFRFYPLELARFLASAESPEEAARSIALAGNFGLVDKIDSSHRFLYGHRYWPQVKAAIDARIDAGTEAASIESEIRAIAKAAVASAKAKDELTLGIAAAGLMTLVQVGADAFRSAAGVASKPDGIMSKSPDAIVAERAKDDSQGLFGFLKTV